MLKRNDRDESNSIDVNEHSLTNLLILIYEIQFFLLFTVS